MSQRKVVLISNGMSVLGTAICQRMQRDGFTVAASYPAGQRTPEAWLSAQRDDGFSFSAWCTDVGEFDDCAALVGKVLAAHGRLDVLVNLAGEPGEAQAGEAGDPGAGLGQLTPDSWRAALRMSLDGAFNMDKHALAPMLEQRWGRIIHLAASPAWAPPGSAECASQAAANAGLHGLTKSLALEMARQGVTVNTVVPGYLRHDPGAIGAAQVGGQARGQAQANDAAIEASLLPRIPVGRLGEAADVAALIAYLASDNAAFLTGAQIAINGGQHMC